MHLPRALAPWATALREFPVEASEVLGPMIRRLSSAIGPLASVSRSVSGEPDGFADLCSNGTYDRLLMSEWLLAEEWPDEFLRRAAMREHLFLNVNRTEPVKELASCVLFDSGPNQLGSPRLAQLALLIVFAQRAEAAGARFYWGMLQDATRQLFVGLSASEVRVFLNSRTIFEVGETDREEWRARLAKAGVLDTWVVSSMKSLSNQQVLIEDVLEPGIRQLSVTVDKTGSVQKVALHLPGEMECARLLRDPFFTRVAALASSGAAGRPASNILFSANNRVVWALSQNGDLLSFAVPNSPSARANGPKRYQRRPNETIIGAVRLGRKPVIVSGENGVLRLRHAGNQNMNLEYSVEGFHYPTQRLLPCHYAGEKNPVLVIQDDSSKLFRLSMGSPRVAECISHSVRAFSTHLNLVRFVAPNAEGAFLRYLLKPQLVCEPLEMSCQSAFSGYGDYRLNKEFGCLAAKDERGWALIDSKTRERWDSEPTGEVIGLLRTDTPPSIGLLVLQDDKRTVTLEWRDLTRKLFVAHKPMRHWVTTPSAPSLAYLTDDGDLTMVNCLTGLELCRYRAPEAR